jgi:DNA-binding NarL/FixJ family response regulator
MAVDLRIAIIDGDPDIRFGRRQVIDSQPDLQVVLEEDTASSALERLPQSLVDVIVLDHRIKGMDGIELAQKLIESYLASGSRVPAIIMTGPYFSASLQLASIAAGAKDLVTQESGPEELLKSIRSSSAKDDQPNFKELRAFLESAKDVQVSVPDLLVRLGTLNEREQQVLEMFEAGNDDEEIARSLDTPQYRVRQVLSSVIAKCGFATRSQLFLALNRSGAKNG